jgi:MtN3 and saliva related transmembrane protein
MKEIVAVIFGLGLLGNALLFVPQVIAVWRKKSDEGISLITFGGFSILQVIGIIHGLYQHDPSLIIGMAASLLTCGSVTGLTILYRMRRISAPGSPEAS